MSGIYSNTFADDKFGVALSASYQERNSGFNQAAVGNGWRAFAGDENNWGTIPQPGQPGSENITNRPDATDTYSVPQNLGYSVNGIERKRTNGQLTCNGVRSTRSLPRSTTPTPRTRSQTERNELSVWFNFGPSTSTWTDGPVAGPLDLLRADHPPRTATCRWAAPSSPPRTRTNRWASTWRGKPPIVSASSSTIHDSSAESGADSPYGSNAVLGVAGFFRGTTTADFTRRFPGHQRDRCRPA